MQHKKKLGRRFWRLWAGVGTSSLGDGIFSVALPLLALRFTRSPLAISGVVVAGQVPAVFAALPFGTLADRLNRRTMIIGIEVARCVLLALFASLVFTSRATLVLVYCAAFLLGGLNIAFDVVAGACLPSIVREDDLVPANAHLLNAELTAENLVGQAVGGAAMAISRSIPFLLDAVTRATSSVLLSRAVPHNEPASGESSVKDDLADGLRWFAGNRVLRLLTGVIASLAFCQGIVLGILALYGRLNLHLGGTGYGLLLAVASIGTVFGGVSARRIHDRLGAGGTLIWSGLIFGLGYPVLALTHAPLVAAAALFFQEGAVIVGSTAARALRQRLVPTRMQGRAASANTLITVSCYPLGGLLGGFVAGALGIRAAFLIAACLLGVFLGITAPRLMRGIRAADRCRQTPALRIRLALDEVIDLRGPWDANAANGTAYSDIRTPISVDGSL